MIQPSVPVNRQAVAALHAAYQVLHGERGSHRWTAEEMITLGRLYVQAWGCLPNRWRMQSTYCLPDASVIRRAWGSFAAYYAALVEGGPEEGHCDRGAPDHPSLRHPGGVPTWRVGTQS